ncbi:peptidoglycan DD-metalloendopeptidase family protein [Lysobacter korlensis]|uniref:Peptidoglycan DD-metalloendopeptidase family protein n=1 Tax=Lysobacter korlensis TaxID=553636 RepID=A0ABV6RUR1_9GAMM
MSRTRGMRLIAALAVAAVLVSTAIAAGPVAPAFAKDWPTWDEVREARADVKSAKAEITRIEGMLEELRGAAAAAAAAASEANQVWVAADEAFQLAHMKAEALQQEADEAKKKAEESRLQAGRLVAQSARLGGGDVGASLFADAENADDLLQMLSRAGQLSQQTEAIYTLAIQQKNTAQALTDEAEAAREVREAARKEAEELKIIAEAAAMEAQAALAEQEAHAAEMEAQLAALRDRESDINAAWSDYQAEQERLRIEQERIRAEQERLRLEREKELAEQWGPGAGGNVKPGVSGGWTWPSPGWISGNYGYRPKPTPTSPAFHYGTDIAAGYCGAPIYAASGGTVSFIGYSPYGYGNHILIDHGDGVSTRYAHIAHGAVKVGWGQNVAPGQLIALTGTTGNSTGCHLHFEVRIHGAVTDPIAFVRSRGGSI